jgi:hypothetical protein
MRKTTIFETGVGFSIELDIGKDWRLELRGEYDGLPLYESLGGKVTAIAIVKTPAIKSKAFGNESDRTFVGAVMIPDLKIFRNQGPNGREKCYWYFSAETIKTLQEEFDGGYKLGH